MFARTRTGIKHMSKTNVGANLMFARRTKTDIKPMFDNELETFASDIGSQTIIVRRANTRFAPTLVFLISLILVFVRGEHKVRPTRRITKYILRSTRKFCPLTYSLTKTIIKIQELYNSPITLFLAQQRAL